MPAEKKMKAKELKRKNVVEALKHMDEFLVNYAPDEHQYEVPLRLERLEKLNEAFEMIQSEYEQLDDSEQFLIANMECRAKIEEQYFRIKASLISKMPQPVPVPVAQTSASEPQLIPSGLAKVKLPTITLPEFDGDFNNWLTFHDTFVSMIHASTEISCVQKFHYLRAALKGEAANLIQSITITAANYSVAWDTLVKLYSNKAILRKKHIRALLKYPKILNSNVDALHKIVDDFQRHVKVLQQLGEPVEHFSSILIELLEDKLDDASLQAWEESVSSEEQPTYTKLIEFLLKRTRVLENILINRPQHANPKSGGQHLGNKKPFQFRVNTNAMTEAAPKMFPPCPACERDKHPMVECPVFNGLDVKGRLKVLTDKKLCSNCFRSDHFARTCRSKYRCRHCHKRHHSMIHPGPFRSAENDPVADRAPPGAFQIATAVATPFSPDPVQLNAAAKETSGNVILSTVVLLIVDAYGQEHIARALLDTGSQPNAISEHLCQQLHLPRKIVNVPIAGVDGITTNSKYQIRAEIRSRVTGFKGILDFLVLRKVTSDTPPRSYTVSQWKIPDGIQLADPEFNVSRRIDLIIGAGDFYTQLLEGRLRLATNKSLLVESVFGWIVTGKTTIPAEEAQQAPVTCHVATVTSVEKLLERFWAVEEVSKTNYSITEQECEDLFSATTTRDATGRYIVRLPKQSKFEQLIGGSKFNALRRFKWLEQKLEKDADLKQHYCDFMAEYISLEHMRAIPEDHLDGPEAFYLPHHPVIKTSSTTTKVRVVFDGSARSKSGHSLNDALLVGPVVQDELLSNILRFRKFPIALVADIEKMYRQVLIHPVDRRLQRIFWRFNSTQPIGTYELSTVTYGLAPSSFLATRTLHQLVNDEGNLFPKAGPSVKKCMYVDDFIGGEHSVEQAIQLRNELNELLQKGGFCLRKWNSNDPKALADLPQELLGTKTSHKFDSEETIKTLGISWEPASDLFSFDVAVNLHSGPATKRSVLSTIAQLFDPLGLIAPVIVQAKILLQHLWLLSLKWDEEVTPEFQTKWSTFCQNLPDLRSFRIDRFAFLPQFSSVELHCFADASEAAYGACIYARSESSDGEVKISLLASKSKVAPLKRITIPRLELCAALLSSCLYEKIIAALEVNFSAVYFWTDSTVVLQWLKAPPRTWKTFIANRVSTIQSTTHGSTWAHVAGADNPADMVSRGFPADELVLSNKWKHGPSWLSLPKSKWPVQQPVLDPNPVEEMEIRPVAVSIAQENTPNPLFLRFSSYQRLLNVVGFCLRFARNAREQNQTYRVREPVLTVEELETAKFVLVKLVQAESFPEEIKNLRRGSRVATRSHIRLLSPFLDAQGIIRVGGRLCLSDEPYSVKHQIVIPGFHPFAKLLINFHHRKVLHGGNSMTLAVVRDEFWPLNGRRAVHNVIRNCFRCSRANPRPIQQPIGQLPVGRVTASEAFCHTGVDYCGPLYLKPTLRRAAARKCYVAVFVCLATKAVHLELVGDLSTNTFLMALDRFIWRRNKPSHIYSDNGTNFIGAKNTLHQLYIMLQPGPEQERISKHLAEDHIQWHLIPPRSPNFGGLWEAAVKVAKKQLIRQLGTATLSYEELTTVLTAVEGCMNSRPLTPLSEDPNDLSALTPAHFLVKNMIRPLPEPDIRNVPMNRLSQYQRVQAYSQRFWYRWRNEYLKQLQTQYSINPDRYTLDVGSVVILKDDSFPPARWPLARVLAIHPVPDNITRVATLRTSAGILKRSVSRICPLPCVTEHPVTSNDPE
ncbi:uncharacterized protein LOC128733054 [Sabethes cyaneus]|uniref:uncharacterized protein LOC128733054 n=1 Tax=Sabethes cyaneus TaxID=53552 RepID=UPI00237EAF01|nr:uncharacterized protein LOC128733054 [Sabethes cyaneus]